MSELANERRDLSKLRATAQEEEDEVQVSRERGLDLVNELFMAMRTFVIHTAENEATNYSIERIVTTIHRLIEGLGTVQFVVAEGEAYINDIRIRVEARNYSNLQHVIQILEGHAAGGMTFSRSLTEEQARALIVTIVKPPDPDRPLEMLRGQLDAAGIPVRLEAPFVQAMGDEAVRGGAGRAAAPASAAGAPSSSAGGAPDAAVPEDDEASASRAQGVAALRDYADVVASEGFANPLKVRRAVQEMIDLSIADFDASLKQQAIEEEGDPYFDHSMNVANLAIAVGQRLGLGKVQLRELGTAAMFHDIGYASLEPPADDDPRRDRRREQIRQLHPITGLITLGNEKGYQPHKARRMRVALEHHMHHRRPGGFPPMFNERLGVFTRIVQVCDHYDAMVSRDPRRGDRLLQPPRALQRIVAGAGERFDPVVVKALVLALGRYPFGTLVALSSGERAIVVGGGRPGAGFRRPLVRVIARADGAEVDEQVDLLDDPAGRRIVRVLDPDAEGIDVDDLTRRPVDDLNAVIETTDALPPPVREERVVAPPAAAPPARPSVDHIGPPGAPDDDEPDLEIEIDDDDDDEPSEESSTVSTVLTIIGPDDQRDEIEIEVEVED